MKSLNELFSLKGHVGLVTGASSGLGVECAHALALAGADVAIAARRGDRLERFAADLRHRGILRAAEFSWSRAATQTWSAIDRAIGKR